MTDVDSPIGLLRNFQTQLEHSWARYRGLEGDDSSRGESYEDALSRLLKEYFGGRFDVLTNCSLMDREMDCFDSFEKGARNEVDVVCLFSQTSPRVILREGKVTWAPLEGVSLLCEVKSRVDKGRLESDLRKLEIIRDLEQDPNDRFAAKMSGDYTVDRQLHCLVYDQSSISDKSLSDLLGQSDAWDLTLIVEDDTLIINNTIPAMEHISPMAISSQVRNLDRNFKGVYKVDAGEVNAPCLSVSRGLAWFILTVSLSVPVPWSVGAAATLSNLMREMVTGVKRGTHTPVSEEDLVEWEPADEDEL